MLCQNFFLVNDGLKNAETLTIDASDLLTKASLSQNITGVLAA
jgi:hypothetical protein